MTREFGEVQPESEQSEEVRIKHDIDQNSALMQEFNAKVKEFQSKGPTMKEADAEVALAYIQNQFIDVLKNNVTLEMLVKEPRIAEFAHRSLAYALFKSIVANKDISDSLKRKIFIVGKYPEQTQKPKKVYEDIGKSIIADAGLRVEGIRDPLLNDPFVPLEKLDESTIVAGTVDAGIDEFYQHIFEGDETIGNKKDLTPTQRLVLAITYVHFFGPIMDNLRMLDVERSNPELLDIPFDTLSRELSKVAKVIGKEVLRSVISAKDFDISKLRNLLMTITEVMDGYNASFVPVLDRLLPKWAAIYLGRDIGKGLMDIEEKDNSRQMSIVRSLLELSADTAYFLKNIEKRKLDDVIKNRPLDAEKTHRLKIVVQFFTSLREQVRDNKDKTLVVSMDFALSILARLKDDTELAELGQNLKPVFRYLFSIPGGPKESILRNPLVAKFIKDHPNLVEDIFTFFIPQKPNLGEQDEKEFVTQYGAVFKVITDVMRNPKVKLDNNIRYLVVFALENIKTYFKDKKKDKIFQTFTFVADLLNPYKKMISNYSSITKALKDLEHAV
ncbi:MAG: hypothetical protein AAB373_01970 [Patescibacteria group bacterium]